MKSFFHPHPIHFFKRKQMNFITTKPTNSSNNTPLEIILPGRIYTPVSPPSTPPTTPITGKKTPASPTSTPPSNPVTGKKTPVSPESKPAPETCAGSDSEEEVPYHVRWADELARRRRRHFALQRAAEISK